MNSKKDKFEEVKATTRPGFPCCHWTPLDQMPNANASIINFTVTSKLYFFVAPFYGDIYFSGSVYTASPHQWFLVFHRVPKYVTSTWVLKTRLIEKKIPIIFFQAKFSEIERRFQKCKSQNREQRASKVRALFLTFPHEKNTLQWSKVASEAIFPTN